MAGDPPPDLPLVQVVPLLPLGAPAGPALEPDRAFTPLLPELFALAWFIAGGHDGAAAHVVDQTRDRFVASWTGATDPMSYARLLLVPRACRAARGVRPRPTGDALLDLLLAVQPRARAALVLHEAIGLDDPAVGQLLEVDRHAAASLQLHALGACRFVGVPELVRDTYDRQVARAVDGGIPAATRPRLRRTPVLVAAGVVVALLAGTVAWQTQRGTSSFVPADASVTHYVVLDAPGWRRGTFDVSTVGYSEMPRLYARTGPDRLVTARLIVLPFPERPSGLGDGTSEQVGDHRIAVQGTEPQMTVWITAPCGSAAIASFGIERDELVAVAATMSCEPDGSRRVVPSRGLDERAFPSVERAVATSANYVNDNGWQLYLRAEPALLEPELAAGGGARLVRRDGRRYIVARGDPDLPRVTVHWQLGDALVTLVSPAALDEAAVIELATQVRAVDEASFHADRPTTTR